MLSINVYSKRFVSTLTHLNIRKINYSCTNFGLYHSSQLFSRNFASKSNEVIENNKEIYFDEDKFSQGTEFGGRESPINILLDDNDISSDTLVNETVNVTNQIENSSALVSDQLIDFICELNSSGTPLWQILTASIIGLRIFLLPIIFYSTKTSVKLKRFANDLSKIQSEIIADPTIPEVEKQQIFLKKQMELYKQWDISPITPLKYLLFQAPIYAIYFTTIGHLIRNLPTAKSAEFLFFSDFSSVDSTLILPAIFSTLTYFLCLPLIRLFKLPLNLAKGIMIGFVPLMSLFPKGMLIIFIPNMLFSLFMQIVLIPPLIQYFEGQLPHFRPINPTTGGQSSSTTGGQSASTTGDQSASTSDDQSTSFDDQSTSTSGDQSTSFDNQSTSTFDKPIKKDNDNNNNDDDDDDEFDKPPKIYGK